jgi:mono/diheme cytochrome c family protein
MKPLRLRPASDQRAAQNVRFPAIAAWLQPNAWRVASRPIRTVAGQRIWLAAGWLIVLGVTASGQPSAPVPLPEEPLPGVAEPVARAASVAPLAATADELETLASSLEAQVASLLEEFSPEAARGYRHLLERPYLPADFNQSILEAIIEQGSLEGPLSDPPAPPAGCGDSPWQLWQRFGLGPRPGEESSSVPLQYVLHGEGQYSMNCFACHGGQVYGVSYPGAPNNLIDLEGLTDRVRRIRLQRGEPLTHLDLGGLLMPLGTTTGTTNAVMFGVALMNYRDADLGIDMARPPIRLDHHDMDAPPWWHFARKSRMYIDGFAGQGSRGLMQFMLVRENGPEQFQAWESEFEDIFAFLKQLRPPKYPLQVDPVLAEQGRELFRQQCSRCHGSYGPGGSYPELVVGLEEVGTDPVRLKGLGQQHKQAYAESWLTRYGEDETWVETDGYVAPPLDGIWASAPYLHNGSLPTLWHVLDSSSRPVIWRRQQLGPDLRRVGLLVEEREQLPPRTTKEQRRWYYDARQRGKSNRGHTFGDALSVEERLAVIEYLKTL